MAVNRNPTVRQRRFGRMLRELRMGANKTLTQVAEELQCARSKMCRLEGWSVRCTPPSTCKSCSTSTG